MPYDKTTLNIPPAESQPLYQLAAAMGFRRAGNGNLTRLCRHLIELVQAEGAEAVAARLRHPARPALCPEAKGLRASGQAEQESEDGN